MVRMEMWTWSVKTTRLSVRWGSFIPVTETLQADKGRAAETRGQFHRDNNSGWRSGILKNDHH